jgi:NAD(P)-dependent dehydrogenase (short-subunit alcohol dehydrogenase family)
MDPDDLTGRRVLVPGGSGAVGEGVVRAYLAAGADVVVPTRSPDREKEFRTLLGAAATARLHLMTHDYTTFAGAEQLAATMVDRLGGIDDVVSPIGGWWAGKHLSQIDESDWAAAFTGLATAHMAVARAVLPRLSGRGAFTVVVGESASYPIPGSGLVSMEQAAVFMMRKVLAAEAGERLRIHALVLGPVRTRLAAGEPGWVSAEMVGAVAVALSGTHGGESREVSLRTGAEADRILLDRIAEQRRQV